MAAGPPPNPEGAGPRGGLSPHRVGGEAARGRREGGLKPGRPAPGRGRPKGEPRGAPRGPLGAERKKEEVYQVRGGKRGQGREATGRRAGGPALKGERNWGREWHGFRARAGGPPAAERGPKPRAEVTSPRVTGDRDAVWGRGPREKGGGGRARRGSRARRKKGERSRV